MFDSYLMLALFWGFILSYAVMIYFWLWVAKGQPLKREYEHPNDNSDLIMGES